MEFEIEMKKNNKFEIDIENVVKEIHPKLDNLEVKPSAEQQNFDGTYGKVIVLGDENLVSGNIKEGKIIFGVSGNYKSIDTTLFTGTNYMFRESNIVTPPLFDTSNVKYMESMFNSCSNLKTVPLYNTSNVTSMYRMFYYSTSLVSIPKLDTSKNKNFTSMFEGCSNLVDVPELDGSSVNWTGTGTVPFSKVFKDCPKLSNDSLNNILAFCTSMTASKDKTLAYIGLTSEQANICKTLSNYQAFVDAGWTIGY